MCVGRNQRTLNAGAQPVPLLSSPDPRGREQCCLDPQGVFPSQLTKSRSLLTDMPCLENLKGLNRDLSPGGFQSPFVDNTNHYNLPIFLMLS